MEVRELETQQGLARAHVDVAPGARAVLALGHGAGGSVTAKDLQAAAGVAREQGLGVVLVEQPYRVAGRKSTPRPHILDAAWLSVIEQLALDAPLIAGGRSSGARVACRTAAATQAIGVLCLAFPLLAPARKGGERPSRQDELDAVEVPVLIVQGDRDPFGMPEPKGLVEVARVTGDHRLSGDMPAVRAAIAAWLPRVVG